MARAHHSLAGRDDGNAYGSPKQELKERIRGPSDHVIVVTVTRDSDHGLACFEDLVSGRSGAGMTGIGKFAAVLLSIAIFAMPAATMPLHCILKAPSSGSTHPCHMMGMNPSADRINAAPVNRSCCEVSAARPESITVPQAPVTRSVAPTASQAFLSDLPAAPVVHGSFDWNVKSPGGPPQAVLCTFLI
jgi:hypothetical protein